MAAVGLGSGTAMALDSFPFCFSSKTKIELLALILQMGITQSKQMHSNNYQLKEPHRPRTIGKSAII